MDRVVLDRDRGTVFFADPGVELNLGSIGKGWAVDRVAADLKGAGLGRALVGAGGSSLLGWGPDPWPLGLTPGGEPLGEVCLAGGALATSGAGEQGLDVPGRRLGHVIDPRTGWPAEGVQSASVVADEATTADALATAFLVGGPSLAREWCVAHPGTLALLVRGGDPRTLLAIGHRDGVDLEPAPGLRVVADEDDP
jgi:thiamine biosynthesis lipoprotein